MEGQKISNIRDSGEDDCVPLPGFRFHPTDEELVGFYLRRKVEMKPILIELIKQIDIYKHDPWDLPKASNVGDKDWYFFCKRGRKYRNSIRPNRVTGSGFWKATGIDRPIYSSTGEGRDCIGLKKSLVYYCGSAGKGTKTDWMMHEFRLPPRDIKSTKNIDDKTIAQEAEVWTLCRILKRIVSNKKYIIADSISKRCNGVVSENWEAGNISFRALDDKKATFGNNKNYDDYVVNGSSSMFQAPLSTSQSGSFSQDMKELLKYGDWDELKYVVEYGPDPYSM